MATWCPPTSTGVQTSDVSTTSYEDWLSSLRQALYDWLKSNNLSGAPDDEGLWANREKEAQKALADLQKQYDENYKKAQEEGPDEQGNMPAWFNEYLNGYMSVKAQLEKDLATASAMQHAANLAKQIKEATPDYYQRLYGQQNAAPTPTQNTSPDFLTAATGQNNNLTNPRPAFVKPISGQMAQKWLPSQVEMAKGLVDFSAGKVPGAWPSGEDWYSKSMSLLPRNMPRPVFKWASK